MPEKDTIFASKIKYTGILPFKDFYNFCYSWLTEETELELAEEKYKEKITGDAKDIEIEWVGVREVTDYFKFEIKIKFQIFGLIEVEVQEGNAKIKTNKGIVKMNIKGMLVRDYEGKFEKTAGRKFLRSIYEKWVIPSRIKEYEDKLVEDSDEFLTQAKAYLDLEGKKQ